MSMAAMSAGGRRPIERGMRLAVRVTDLSSRRRKTDAERKEELEIIGQGHSRDGLM